MASKPFPFRPFGACLAAALAVSTAQPVRAEDETVTWKQDVRGWYIGVDRTTDDGCFMVTSYDGGALLRAQFFPQDGDFGLMVGNADWRSIEGEKLYEVALKFGNRAPWTGNARGLWIGNIPFLVVDVPFEGDKANKFIDEFMRMTVVNFTYQGDSIARLKLTGTYVAMQETMDCQIQMFDAGTGGDPFRNKRNSGSGADPFQ